MSIGFASALRPGRHPSVTSGPLRAVSSGGGGGGGFAGGDVAYGSVKEMAEAMVAASAVAPTAGGTLTLNSVALGSYDYTIKSGAQVISAFTASDWFTTTKDTRSAWIVVNGNLTIDAGQTVIPTVRKLFTVVYVAGNLTVDGSISMTARGANHNGTGDSGGATTAGDLRIATGTFSGVSNPQVPAAGAAGGATSTAGSNVGSAGSSGATGGGGGGAGRGGATGGSGATGTTFSGGSGGGGGRGANGTNAVANGGAGGDGGSNGSAFVNGGGAGNLGGLGYSGTTPSPTNDGAAGTGGVLIIICTGTLSGSGTIAANGSLGGGVSASTYGGGSGGGSVTVLYGVDSGPTPTATGGVGGGTPGTFQGGAAGDGTARKLAL